jgi:hypothetical protein
MNRALAILLLLFSMSHGLAQGTVNFANGAAGVDAPVWLDRQGQALSGESWRAELFLIMTDGVKKRIRDATPFVNDRIPGYFMGGLTVVPEVAPGRAVTLEVRVFNLDETYEGISNPINVVLGGDKFPPSNLVGLRSWIVAPSTPQLSVLSTDGSLILRWKLEFQRAILESASSLLQPDWKPVLVDPQEKSGMQEVKLPATGEGRYFRLRL